MRDNQHVMTEFVKIVERYPVIYDRRLDSHRTRYTEVAWKKVAEGVRNEIHEECSIEELKMKWKGIRSSYGRYKNKLIQSSDGQGSCKKYYLYDSLKYLEPFTLCVGKLNQDEHEEISEKSSNFVDVDDSESFSDNTEEYGNTDIKPEIENKDDTYFELHTIEKASHYDNMIDSDSTNSKRRKISNADTGIDDDDDENLQFFKSILPDIRGFTMKEKRKLKMGILKLIDDLENERQLPK